MRDQPTIDALAHVLWVFAYVGISFFLWAAIAVMLGLAGLLPPRLLTVFVCGGVSISYLLAAIYFLHSGDLVAAILAAGGSGYEAWMAYDYWRKNKDDTKKKKRSLANRVVVVLGHRLGIAGT